MMSNGAFSVQFAASSDSGLTFSCKEMFDVPGYPATAGHPQFAQYRKHTEASDVIRHLLNAGCRLVGKTVQSELAISAAGENRFTPPPVNAVNEQWWPGGSSSGCAVAVARGLVHFSVATDTAGSARIPAACNRVVGLAIHAPTLLQGAVSFAPSLDDFGIITRDILTLQKVLNLLHLPANADYPEELFVPIDVLQQQGNAETLRAFRKTLSALRQAGWTIHEVSGADFAAVDAFEETHGSLALAEIAAALKPLLPALDLDPGLCERLEPYFGWSAALLERVQHALVRLRAAMLPRTWMLPTLPRGVAPRSADPASYQLSRFTKYANVMGQHAISVPGGRGVSSLSGMMLQSSNLAHLLGASTSIEEIL